MDTLRIKFYQKKLYKFYANMKGSVESTLPVIIFFYQTL